MPLIPARAAPELVSACDFAQLPPLRPTQRYGIFGDDTFDTAVCGYVVTQAQQRYDSTITAAYLRIVQFQDPKFEAAIARGIRQGNRVNQRINGVYELSLGCLEQGQIQVDRPNGAGLIPLLSVTVQQQLSKASAHKPLPVVLSFEQHPGSACLCCSLAERVSLAPGRPIKNSDSAPKP